jgi:hypothetical protein
VQVDRGPHQCGHVGCCDDSKNKHATKHFHQTKHPVIQPFQPGEDWLWCFVDELFVEDRPESPAAHP